MTNQNNRTEFKNTNDKYNRTTICIDLYRGTDAEKFCDFVLEELKKAIDGSNSDFEIKCTERRIGHIEGLPCVIYTISKPLSTKTCITLAENIALMHPVIALVLSGQMCYYPQYENDEDNDELYGDYRDSDFYTVDVLSISYAHRTGFMSVSQLPFYYFESIKENNSWWSVDGQSRIDDTVNLMHSIGRDSSESRYFIPDGSKQALCYESVADRMEFCVLLPAAEATVLRQMIDEDNDGAEYSATIFNAKDCDGGKIHTVTITRYCRNEQRGADCRMAFLHWILHNFHVESLMGNGYAHIPDKDVWMPVERYDYIRGRDTIGRLSFNVLDPELVRYAAGCGKAGVCQLVGEVLYDTHKHTPNSETMWILVRPADKPGKRHMFVPHICTSCGWNNWGQEAGYKEEFCCVGRATEFMLGRKNCDDRMAVKHLKTEDPEDLHVEAIQRWERNTTENKCGSCEHWAKNYGSDTDGVCTSPVAEDTENKSRFKKCCDKCDCDGWSRQEPYRGHDAD